MTHQQYIIRILQTLKALPIGKNVRANQYILTRNQGGYTIINKDTLDSLYYQDAQAVQEIIDTVSYLNTPYEQPSHPPA